MSIFVKTYALEWECQKLSDDYDLDNLLQRHQITYFYKTSFFVCECIGHTNTKKKVNQKLKHIKWIYIIDNTWKSADM